MLYNCYSIKTNLSIKNIITVIKLQFNFSKTVLTPLPFVY